MDDQTRAFFAGGMTMWDVQGIGEIHTTHGHMVENSTAGSRHSVQMGHHHCSGTRGEKNDTEQHIACTTGLPVSLGDTLPRHRRSKKKSRWLEDRVEIRKCTDFLGVKKFNIDAEIAVLVKNFCGGNLWRTIAVCILEKNRASTSHSLCDQFRSTQNAICLCCLPHKKTQLFRRRQALQTLGENPWVGYFGPSRVRSHRESHGTLAAGGQTQGPRRIQGSCFAPHTLCCFSCLYVYIHKYKQVF